jgi:hypothetical protein
MWVRFPVTHGNPCRPRQWHAGGKVQQERADGDARPEADRVEQQGGKRDARGRPGGRHDRLRHRHKQTHLRAGKVDGSEEQDRSGVSDLSEHQFGLRNRAENI